GGCLGSGDATDCHPDLETCTGDSRSCPCTIDVFISTGHPDRTCHIAVISADGARFETSVDVTYGNGPCAGVFLVDESQSTIEVHLPDGGVDSGSLDGATA